MRSPGPATVGEVQTRSPYNMLGYWNRAGRDAPGRIDEDGIVLDRRHPSYLDADGYLYLHDRIKDMIVSGGENIYPAEVENALLAHAAVADAAVIGVPDDKWGETVKAIVVEVAGGRALTRPPWSRTSWPARGSGWPTTSARHRSTSSTSSRATRRARSSSESCASALLGRSGAPHPVGGASLGRCPAQRLGESGRRSEQRLVSLVAVGASSSASARSSIGIVGNELTGVVRIVVGPAPLPPARAGPPARRGRWPRAGAPAPPPAIAGPPEPAVELVDDARWPAPA